MPVNMRKYRLEEMADVEGRKNDNPAFWIVSN